MDAIRLYRNLVLLKRGGRGHDTSDISATLEGSLAVICPACPYPGRNIPSDWEQTPSSTRWIYTLYLMLDANFKLRSKDRGIVDVELAPGWAYYVNEVPFQRHIDAHHRQHGDQLEENTCSAEHNTIVKANIRKEGYIASGVGAVFCARHCLVRPCGVADLQKGERYVNMDYLLLKTLACIVHTLLLLSYDIACQYNKNFMKRMKAFPDDMQLRPTSKIRFAIPKKHFAVHGANHSKYSLNFLPHVARTYGEGIESAWHVSNGMSSATSEMGPGARHENLNDHWGAWNWEKILGLGSSIMSAFTLSMEKSKKHATRFESFSATFPTATIAMWNTNWARWMSSPGVKPDPFEELETRNTLNDIRLKLAEEDASEMESGAFVGHEVSPGVFVQMGLDIEDRQRTLVVRAKDKLTVGEQANLQDKRNKLAHRIELWRKLQEVYMPTASPLRTSPAIPSLPESETPDNDTHMPPSSTVKAEDIKLWLPSHLPDRLRTSEAVKPIAERERRLREAQAFDALANIRRIRRIITGISEFRKLNLKGDGQRANTRLRSYYDKFHAKINASVACYRAARAALLVLDPNGTWKAHLLELSTKDVRGPNNEDNDVDNDEDNDERDSGGINTAQSKTKETRARGEGHYEISWIWLVQPGIQGKERVANDFSDGMRVEWAKARARTDRWQEEALLLQEEMRRTLEYLKWDADLWRSRAAQRASDNPCLSAALLQGLAAYAEKQAIIRDTLARKFAKLWRKQLAIHNISPDWLTSYPITSAESTAQAASKGKRKANVMLMDSPTDGEEDDNESSDTDTDTDMNL
ncbi:hypothetical protein EUX98_g8912 [Antrodiella citrinella]|uniref:CxC2-like cysteine cluster KDZ transposase-associated domain-containing protein n=1 Tax=Antrodiella citrinella TaxID=2447956 RepID=A0A4S4M2W1_9APHY|nr:hypothetical protein EUX98_g8912 [Antrodiella citrinella]